MGPLEMQAMSESELRTERFTVEGFLDGGWHLVLSSDERETAIRGAGSVVISGAFEFVRIMLNGVVPGLGRELVRIDRHGTVRNGAFVENIAAPSAPAQPVEDNAQERDKGSNGLRPAVGATAAVVLFAVGIAVGNWAIQII